MAWGADPVINLFLTSWQLLILTQFQFFEFVLSETSSAQCLKTAHSRETSRDTKTLFT